MLLGGTAQHVPARKKLEVYDIKRGFNPGMLSGRGLSMLGLPKSPLPFPKKGVRGGRYPGDLGGETPAKVQERELSPKAQQY